MLTKKNRFLRTKKFKLSTKIKKNKRFIKKSLNYTFVPNWLLSGKDKFKKQGRLKFK